MRSKEVLNEIVDAALLLQYLYMSEKHSITFNNGVADLTLRMDENLNILCQNMNFPDFPETYWNDNMSPSNCLDIMHALKQMPAIEHKQNFGNRWEEIRTITKMNLVQNTNRYENPIAD